MPLQPVLPIERIAQSILVIRGQKVMIDADLAALYGVATKRLNEQVKRNIDRFPADFMFQLNPPEKDEVVANCDLKDSHSASVNWNMKSPGKRSKLRLTCSLKRLVVTS